MSASHASRAIGAAPEGHLYASRVVEFDALMPWSWAGPGGGTPPDHPVTFQSFTGTTGDDNFVGTAGDDSFVLSQGGNDSAYGGDGDDRFTMGAALTANDTIDGGGDSGGFGVNVYDVLSLSGDYSAGITFNATTIKNIEEIRLLSTDNYALKFDDANVAAGGYIGVYAHPFSTSWVHLDASAETNGKVIFVGSRGDDILIGGAGNDTLRPGEGTDFVDGGAGIDTLSFNDSFKGVTIDLSIQGVAQNTGPGVITFSNVERVIGSLFGDTIFGTDGNDFIGNGANNSGPPYSGVDFLYGEAGDDTISITHNIYLTGVEAYGGDGTDMLSFRGSSAAPGVTFQLADSNAQETGFGPVTASSFENLQGTWFDDRLKGNASANVIYSAEGSDRLSGRGGDDVLYGDQADFGTPHVKPLGSDILKGQDGDDLLFGGAMRDRLQGGSGRDTFGYEQSADSVITDRGFDIIGDFDAAEDMLRFWFEVAGVDAEIVGGQLRKHSMDVDLATAVDQPKLTANHAVLFAPDSGHYQGHVFLIVDANATAGYQVGDVVIELADIINTGSFGVENFTTS